MASGELHLKAEEDKKKVKPIPPAAGHSPNDHDKLIGWIIPPRALSIVWGIARICNQVIFRDKQYWNITDDYAELIQVKWLEVTGAAHDLQLEKGRKYDIFFRVSLKQRTIGWKDCPAFMMVKLGKSGNFKWKRLTQISDDQERNTVFSTDKLQITATGREEDRSIYFGLLDIWSGKWKGGLIIHEVRVELVP